MLSLTYVVGPIVYQLQTDPLSTVFTTRLLRTPLVVAVTR